MLQCDQFTFLARCSFVLARDPLIEIVLFGEGSIDDVSSSRCLVVRSLANPRNLKLLPTRIEQPTGSSYDSLRRKTQNGEEAGVAGRYSLGGISKSPAFMIQYQLPQIARFLIPRILSMDSKSLKSRSSSSLAMTNVDRTKTKGHSRSPQHLKLTTMIIVVSSLKTFVSRLCLLLILFHDVVQGFVIPASRRPPRRNTRNVSCQTGRTSGMKQLEHG